MKSPSAEKRCSSLPFLPLFDEDSSGFIEHRFWVGRHIDSASCERLADATTSWLMFHEKLRSPMSWKGHLRTVVSDGQALSIP
jgi:hypothetical protein